MGDPVGCLHGACGGIVEHHDEIFFLARPWTHGTKAFCFYKIPYALPLETLKNWM